MEKLGRRIRWLLIAIVKPLIALWLIVSGIPPAIRAIGQETLKIIKHFDAEPQRRRAEKKTESTTNVTSNVQRERGARSRSRASAERQ